MSSFLKEKFNATDEISRWKNRLREEFRTYEKEKASLVSRFSPPSEGETDEDKKKRESILKESLEELEDLHSHETAQIGMDLYDGIRSRILEEKEEQHQIPHQVYENILYSALSDRLSRQQGYFSAVKSSESTILDINTNMGDSVCEIDPNKVLGIMTSLDEICMIKHLSSCFLSQGETDQIVSLLIEREFGRKGVKTKI